MSLAKQIESYMSLRLPQAEALLRLEAIASNIDFKSASPEEVTDVARRVLDDHPELVFDTDFPSFCFALATGVGKTRLMGACIYLLWKLKGYRNYFIVAPNKTIYNKLRHELRASNEKFMFLGLSDAPQLKVYDGDNYINYKKRALFEKEEVFIFLFNIQKIHPSPREQMFKFHKENEDLGTSFSTILQSMDDLVVLMDESHRYRAPASLRAINLLKPALGLEFTATPKYAKNILYSFTLGQAIGRYVKTPTVVTRTNLTISDREATEKFPVSEGQYVTLPIIELIKLKDGLLLHDRKKARLEEFCRANRFPLVKPFVLISTKDTNHARDIRAVVESHSFFEGRYKNKVIEIHSNQTGSESDENIEKLLSVENPTSNVEVVIHVNMLKEGWDVKNLYIIIPLRASVSEILTEQTIGRGLRLPFPLTESEVASLSETNPDIIELEIISHDRYEEIIRAARDSRIFKNIKELSDDDTEPLRATYVPTLFSAETKLALQEASAKFGPISSQELADNLDRLDLFVEEIIERQTETLINEASKSSLEQSLAANQSTLFPSPEGIRELIDIEELKQEIRIKLKAEIKAFAEKNIDIPRITTYVEPKAGIRPFTPTPRFINLEIVEQRLRLANLVTGEERHGETVEVESIDDPKIYLAGRLLEEVEEFDTKDKDFALKLAEDYLNALQRPDGELKQLLHLYRSVIVEDLRKQVLEHIYDETTIEYKVRSGFIVFEGFNKTIRETNGVLDLRDTINEPSKIRQYLFQGIRKSLFDKVSFDSLPEKNFAVVLESDYKVEKWLRPPLNQLPIYYQGGIYNLDFVVETENKKYLIEIKAKREINDPIVSDKAHSAIKWCEVATEVEGSKPWEYKLVPDDAVSTTNDFSFIINHAVPVNGYRHKG